MGWVLSFRPRKQFYLLEDWRRIRPDVLGLEKLGPNESYPDEFSRQLGPVELGPTNIKNETKFVIF